MKTKFPIASNSQYDTFRKYFPFSCIDLLIFDNDHILLTRRKLNPFKGFWHLPGGLIRKQESMCNAIKRLAKQELGITVDTIKYVGVYESLDKFRHDLSHGYVVAIRNGTIKLDINMSDFNFFKIIPKQTIQHQKKMIKDARKMIKKY